MSRKYESATGCDEHLPLVSIIIVNYNYCSYLVQALESASNQTYDNIEIIVIDDVSTDASWTVIQEQTGPEGPYAAARAYQMPRNGGHALAAAAGFERTTGSYVIFLDADDVLMPNCVEAHVYAHLSSRIAVGFSSVDVFCWGRDQWVTSTFGSDRAKHIASLQGSQPRMIRPIEKAAPEVWSSADRTTLSLEEMHIVQAPFCEWVWSPMSGNCFRRDALDLFLKEPGLGSIRNGFDAYLMHPISSLCGSLLIDRPLVGYRIHHTNVFIKSAPLARMLTFDTKLASDFAPKEAVRKTFAIVVERGDIFERPDFFYASVKSQCCVWPGLKADHGGGEFLIECLISYQSSLVSAFGKSTVTRWLSQEGFESDGDNKRWHTPLLSRLRFPVFQRGAK